MVLKPHSDRKPKYKLLLVYVLRGVRTWKSYAKSDLTMSDVRLKRISRIAILIGFQNTYECSSKWICTNRFMVSCSSLPFRLSKYDRISVGFAQKTDLGWHPERGFNLVSLPTLHTLRISLSISLSLNQITNSAQTMNCSNYTLIFYKYHIIFNFMMLRECILCIKKTQIMTLFNNSSLIFIY